MGNEYQRFLMHHGVKGQKWGVRRFQNPDGTLTPLGKARRKQGNLDGIEVSSYALTAAQAKIQTTKRRIQQDERYVDRKKLYTNPVWKKNKRKYLEYAEKYSNDKKYASERENEEIDPETGLYLTGKKMTEEENMERINPSIYADPRDPIDSYFDNKMFKVNCNCCTMAMELRERGYDVHAGTDGEEMFYLVGIRDAEKKNNWYTGESPYKNTKKYEINGDDVVKAFHDDITKEPNSRGEIFMDWCFEEGGGHSIFYKVDHQGTLTAYDTQTCDKLEWWKLEETIYEAKSIEYTRLDNSTPNIQYLKDNNYIC